MSDYSNPVEELERRTDEWLREFCEDENLDPSGFVKQRRNFQPLEAKSLLRVLDCGLIEAGRGGVFPWPRRHGIPPKVFMHGDRKRHPRPIPFANEVIAVFGAAGDLHFDYGWPIDHVEVETAEWAFDLAAYGGSSDDDPMVIAGEAKKSISLLEKLISELRSCGLRGYHEWQDCRRKNSHKKYRGLVCRRPRYFLALAPGVRKAFAVTYDGHLLSLAEVPDVPHFDAR